MKYVAFIGTEGAAPPEAAAIVQRDLPAWIKEMDGRGARLLGRELNLPQTAATVRVRDGETLVTDGPFAETKEFVAGLDVLECADLDEALEVMAKSPVSRFHPFEIRPFRDGLRPGSGAAAFGRGEDSAGIPYSLTVWVGATPPAPLDDQAVTQECTAWRQDLAARTPASRHARASRRPHPCRPGFIWQPRLTRSAARLLRAGGRIGIGFWSDPGDHGPLFAAVARLAPAPPPGTPSPMAFAEPGVAEAFLESAGLTVERRGTAPCVYFYRSAAEAVRGFGSSAPAHSAASHSGAKAVQDALAARVARHADPSSGVIRLAGTMGFVTASRR